MSVFMIASHWLYASAQRIARHEYLQLHSWCRTGLILWWYVLVTSEPVNYTTSLDKPGAMDIYKQRHHLIHLRSGPHLKPSTLAKKP